MTGKNEFGTYPVPEAMISADGISKQMYDAWRENQVAWDSYIPDPPSKYMSLGTVLRRAEEEEETKKSSGPVTLDGTCSVVEAVETLLSRRSESDEHDCVRPLVILSSHADHVSMLSRTNLEAHLRSASESEQKENKDADDDNDEPCVYSRNVLLFRDRSLNIKPSPRMCLSTLTFAPSSSAKRGIERRVQAAILIADKNLHDAVVCDSSLQSNPAVTWLIKMMSPRTKVYFCA